MHQPPISDFNSIPEIGADVRLEYLAEGGANIVYRISLPSQDNKELQPSEIPYYGSSTPPPTEIEDELAMTADMDTDIDIFTGKLLRLRKNVGFGLPYREIANDFCTTIRPLFERDELVDQVLVRVPPALIQQCNGKLQDSERIGKRPVFRHGIYLAEDEPLGMLITDMTNSSTSTTTTTGSMAAVTIAELKPKWLIQSPSAPENARRCRTCALRDMKEADRVQVATLQKPAFCPFDLISEKEEGIQRAIQRIFSANGSSHQTRVIAKALYQHPTLMKLLSLQRLHNEVGLNGPPGDSKVTSLSMTLRDCSIFLKVNDHQTLHNLNSCLPSLRFMVNRIIHN